MPLTLVPFPAIVLFPREKQVPVIKTPTEFPVIVFEDRYAVSATSTPDEKPEIELFSITDVP